MFQNSLFTKIAMEFGVIKLLLAPRSPAWILHEIGPTTTHSFGPHFVSIFHNTVLLTDRQTRNRRVHFIVFFLHNINWGSAACIQACALPHPPPYSTVLCLSVIGILSPKVTEDVNTTNQGSSSIFFTLASLHLKMRPIIIEHIPPPLL